MDPLSHQGVEARTLPNLPWFAGRILHGMVHGILDDIRKNHNSGLPYANATHSEIKHFPYPFVHRSLFSPLDCLMDQRAFQFATR